MYTELSYKFLQGIAEKLTHTKDEKLKSKLDEFLQIQYDEYYVYERKIFDFPVIEITSLELECIITTCGNNNNRASQALDDLQHIQKLVTKSRNSIFLYGGNRI